ncbi:MAG: Xaa-Pro peptidase family protein [Acidobacteriaceae bacterium]
MQGDPERRNRLTRALGAAGLDAILCSSASDVLLCTGYWPVMAMSLSIVTSQGEAHVLLPEDEYELAHARTSACIKTYKPNSLDRVTDLMTSISAPFAGVISSLGLARATIGIRTKLSVQPESYVVSTNFHGSVGTLISSSLPKARLVACDNLLDTQKAAKTPAELSHIQSSILAAGQGFGVAASSIRSGLREHHVASKFQSAFDYAGDGADVERSYGSFYCMSGPNSAKAAAAYARTRQRMIEHGDLVMIHANTCADGFWTDITRTYTAGEATARQQAIRVAIDEARAAALSKIKPGVEAKVVDHAARSVMKSHGLGDAFKHATGHGVGYAAANANGIPRIHPCSPDKLEEGMTFNIEPAAYFEGYGGMRHCDVVAVTSNGCKVLTEF